MALTQKRELWVLEQVIQHTDYNFIKVKLLEKLKLSIKMTSSSFSGDFCIYKMPLLFI